MKVQRVRCYAVTLPLPAEGYTMSHGRALTEIQSTVVEVVAENGTVGYGESCTLGSNYIEGFPGSVRETVYELASTVVGLPVMEADVLNRVMDAAVRGHLAGKAVIDMAMWDLRGKLLDQPISILLGGVHQQTYSVFYPISLGTPEEMGRDAAHACARGYRRWQVKLGEDPVADAERLQTVSEAIGDHNDFLTADANTTWSLAQTCQFLMSIGNRYTFIEQPCRGLWELSQVRNRTTLPVIADEAICNLRDLVACFELRAADAINIKITRVGGLTKAAQLRDVAQAMGLMLMVDEPMGGDIATAAVSHLAASCRPESFLAASHLAEFSQKALISSGGARREGAWAHVPSGPGLGVEVDRAALGAPIFSFP